MATQKTIDITKTGPQGYKQLQEANASYFEGLDDDDMLKQVANIVYTPPQQINPYRDAPTPV